MTGSTLGFLKHQLLAEVSMIARHDQHLIRSLKKRKKKKSSMLSPFLSKKVTSGNCFHDKCLCILPSFWSFSEPLMTEPLCPVYLCWFSLFLVCTVMIVKPTREMELRVNCTSFLQKHLKLRCPRLGTKQKVPKNKTTATPNLSWIHQWWTSSQPRCDRSSEGGYHWTRNDGEQTDKGGAGRKKWPIQGRLCHQTMQWLRRLDQQDDHQWH